MSALTATWPCTHCDEQVPLPVTVTSTGDTVTVTMAGDTVRDGQGRVIGVTLTPHVDTTPALAHLAEAHLVIGEEQ